MMCTKKRSNIIFLLDSAGICGRPRTSRGLRLHGNSYLDGDRVTFSCDKNFDLFGKAELRCVGRAWDSSEPECKGECSFELMPDAKQTNRISPLIPCLAKSFSKFYCVFLALAPS